MNFIEVMQRLVRNRVQQTGCACPTCVALREQPVAASLVEVFVCCQNCRVVSRAFDGVTCCNCDVVIADAAPEWFYEHSS